eukprot:scaffold8302_cov165-Isochrysis_galbana.AAC.1
MHASDDLRTERARARRRRRYYIVYHAADAGAGAAVVRSRAIVERVRGARGGSSRRLQPTGV